MSYARDFRGSGAGMCVNDMTMVASERYGPSTLNLRLVDCKCSTLTTMLLSHEPILFTKALKLVYGSPKHVGGLLTAPQYSISTNCQPVATQLGS